jgi:hypothetical protein
MNLSTGHLLVLDCGVLHDVEALEESALLLTISWRRDPVTSLNRKVRDWMRHPTLARGTMILKGW